jgi:hypothetical protein
MAGFWPRITIRWLMIRIAIVAVASAYLASAAKASKTCGTLLATAVTVVLLLLGAYVVFGLIRFGMRHPS